MFRTGFAAQPKGEAGGMNSLSALRIRMERTDAAKCRSHADPPTPPRRQQRQLLASVFGQVSCGPAQILFWSPEHDGEDSLRIHVNLRAERVDSGQVGLSVP